MKKLKISILILIFANVCLFAMGNDFYDEFFYEEDDEFVLYSDEDCVAGGTDASQCSVQAGISFGGGVTVGCSVTCRGNSYACCGLKCECKPLQLTAPDPDDVWIH